MKPSEFITRPRDEQVRLLAYEQVREHEDARAGRCPFLNPEP